MIQAEREAETTRILERVRAQPGWDLESAEFYVRSAVLALGAKMMEKLLTGVGCGRPPSPVACPCGRSMSSVGLRDKTIRTILGDVALRRSLFQCGGCGKTRIPADEELGVRDTSFSPGARRMMSCSASDHPFAKAAADLKFYAKLEVDAKDVERVAESTGEQVDQWMKKEEALARGRAAAAKPAAAPPATPGPLVYVSFDGTGVPARASELANSKGKRPGEKARTREAKLGCVFTQTTLDEHGRPLRDPESTTYAGAITGSVEFGYRIHAEALRRGLTPAHRVVVITDGAAYNKTIVADHFPRAVHIIDLFHAREHLSNFFKPLGLSTAEAERLRKEASAILDTGKISQLAQFLHQRLPRSGPRRDACLKELNYLEANAGHMRYAHYRSKGYFVGSGVIEAGCKTIIGQRLKNSGMHWTVRGANAIIALRTCVESDRFEHFWEDTARDQAPVPSRAQ